MLTCLAVDIIIALEYDLLAASPYITNYRMNQLANNYRTTYEIVRRHKVRIQAGLPLLARTSSQRRVITIEIDTVIYYLLNKFF